MDRLKDLKQGAVSPDSYSLDIGTPLTSNQDFVTESPMIGGPMIGVQGQGKFMEDFFRDVEKTKENINKIQQASKEIDEINQMNIQESRAEIEQKNSRDLGNIIKETNALAQATKETIQILRDDTETLKSKNPKDGAIRIRKNLTDTLTRKFMDVMKTYQVAQTKYKTDVKQKAKRQIQIVKKDVTDDQIEEVLRNGGTGNLIKTSILAGAASDSVLKAFENVEDKYQDVLKLEKSINELHLLFSDFALLTDLQGEMLDQIEHNVQSASDYIEEGNREMTKATELLINTRKKQCYICFFFLVIIAIVLGVVFGYCKQHGSCGSST